MVKDWTEVIAGNKEFFKSLQFNEQYHIYTLDGRRLQSVSGIIGNFCEEKDWDEIAVKVADKRQIAPTEVKAEWQLAATQGTITHSYAETEHKHRKADFVKEFAVDRFFESLDPQRYLGLNEELRMYHKKTLFAGTLDRVLYDRFKNYDIILDYKTNKDLFRNFGGEDLTGIFHDLSDTAYNKYQIQQNFYHLLYEQTGRKVGEKWIIWLKEDMTFEKLVTMDYTDRLKGWINGKTFYND